MEAEPETETESEYAAPIIQLVNSIIGDALRMRASDIHVEPLNELVRVRYRVDGLLRTVAELPKRIQKPCSSRFKLISGIDIAESRRPQDGRTRVRFRDREVDLRVSVIPTFYGEKVVLRLLDRAGTAVMDMEELGLHEDDSPRWWTKRQSPWGWCPSPTWPSSIATRRERRRTRPAWRTS